MTERRASSAGAPARQTRRDCLAIALSATAPLPLLAPLRDSPFIDDWTYAWSVENLLNRVIDGTLERSASMLATLAEAIGVLPRLVGELRGDEGEVAGLPELVARVEAQATGHPVPAAHGAAPGSPEPTLVLPKADLVHETQHIATLVEVPPVRPPAPAPEPSAQAEAPAEA